MRTYYYFVFRFAENILQLSLKQTLFCRLLPLRPSLNKRKGIKIILLSTTKNHQSLIPINIFMSLAQFGLNISAPRVTQQSFIRERSALRSNPLPFYIPFLKEKVTTFCIPPY